MWKVARLSVFTGLYKQGLPKNQSLLKISVSREKHYANHTNSILKYSKLRLQRSSHIDF